MRLAEMFVAGLAAAAAWQQAGAQRASQPATTHRLMDFSISDICNQGGHWMAPITAEPQMRESPPGYFDEVGYENCRHGISSHDLPEERSNALCLMKVAAASCADGDDPWCIDALLRTATDEIPKAGQALAASLPPGPLPRAIYRSLDQLRRDVHPAFVGRFEYQEAMQGLEIEFVDRTGLDINAQTSPLTVADVLQLLRDSDSGEVVGASTLDRFDWAAKATGLQLGTLLKSIAQETINARPEHYRDDLDAELDTWLGRNFPADPAAAITAHQRRHVIGLMLERINARIPARDTDAQATG